MNWECLCQMLLGIIATKSIMPMPLLDGQAYFHGWKIYTTLWSYNQACDKDFMISSICLKMRNHLTLHCEFKHIQNKDTENEFKRHRNCIISEIWIAKHNLKDNKMKNYITC